jgi:hypothetical protein
VERAIVDESTNYDERVITEILAGIGGGNFFAGIYLVDDEAAPIVSNMRNWSRERVLQYCTEKGWSISVIWEIKRRAPD